MGEYDAFQAAVTQHMGRPLTQEELNNSPFLETLPNNLIRLLPPGRLEAFSSERLVQLDNADLFALVMANPNIANSIPGYRLTQGVQNSDGSWSGGLSSDQLRRVYQRAGEQGIGGPGITELKGVVEGVTGQPIGGGGGGGGDGAAAVGKGGSQGGGTSADQEAWATLAREQWEAQLANEPGNVYEWLARSRGMEPVGGPRQIGGPTASTAPVVGVHGGTGPAPSAVPGSGQSGFGPATGGPTGKVAGVGSGFSTQGASTPPSYGQAGNPWANAGSQIVNQQRPNFNELRGQVQAQGADIPIGILNTVQGKDLPSYTTQGGMPLLAAQNRANMSPAERAVWDVTVNRTGGRAEDDRYQASRLGRTGGAATVAYTGASRTPGTRR